MRNKLGLLCLTLASMATAQEQKAQPPPEFTSGYAVPNAIAPVARAEIWQWVDIAVLIVVLALGAKAVLADRSRAQVRLLSIFSLAYFGFYRLGCVCAIGSVQNVAYAVGHPEYRLPWTVAAMFLIPLAVALFAGRVFCGTACPMGALQDLLLVRPVRVPGWISGPLGTIPYLYLGAAVVYAGLGSAFLICQADPYVAIFRLSGPTNVVVFGAILLVAGLFVGRPYCRFLCPYGVLLRWASLVSKHRVRVSPEGCVNCHLCADACPHGAIQPPSDHAQGRRRSVGISLAILPILVALFAFGGQLLSPTLATGDARVLRGLEVLAEKRDPALLRAEAWRAQRREPADAIREARQAQDAFRTWGTGLGAFFGLVIGLRLLALSRTSARREYEAEPGACVECARCYAACPVPNRAHFAHLGNLMEGSS